MYFLLTEQGKVDLTLARYQLHLKDSSLIKQEIQKIRVYSMRVKE